MHPFDQKQQGKQKTFSVDELHYDQQEDCLYCPMGQKMSLIGFTKRITASGYEVSSRYQAINCHGCPLRGQCHKAQGNRIVDVNHRLKAHKAKADELLTSDQGIHYRKKRAYRALKRDTSLRPGEQTNMRITNLAGK